MRRNIRCAERFRSCVLLLLPLAAGAQELEPRAYSASPVGTNFIVVSFARLSGEVLADPSLPISDVDATIDFQSFGYVRTFGFFGHSASIGFVAPYVQADVSGNVFDAAREVQRTGQGDLRMRVAMNFIGAPALTQQEFARREPATSIGASLTVVAPTGQYTSERLINVGANRWAFKPEIGISQPMGKWFADASAGVWLYTDNNHFLGNQRRSQQPLSVLQLHAGYNFGPGLWLAADVGRYAGGKTEVNGTANQDRQENTRYGLTLSVPLGRGWSGKLSWSNGLATRAGGDFDAYALTLQYRWFDR